MQSFLVEIILAVHIMLAYIGICLQGYFLVMKLLSQK